MNDKLLFKIIDIEARELINKAQLLSAPANKQEIAFLLKEIYEHSLRLLEIAQ